MHGNAAVIEAESKPKANGKARLMTLEDLDRRTRAAQHALGLRDGILSDLGGSDYATIAEQELAQRASVLGAILEDTETRWLKGEPVDFAAYCTTVNAQRRVLADIGLERKTRDISPSFHEIVTQKAQERATDVEASEAT